MSDPPTFRAVPPICRRAFNGRAPTAGSNGPIRRLGVAWCRGPDRVSPPPQVVNRYLLNNRLRQFKTIQRHARTLLAKRRGVDVETVEWRIGCIHDLRDTYLTTLKGLAP